jgi:hypothetical protein
MGVVETKIQTVEEIYGLVWAAVANTHPIAASYDRLRGCFARTGWAGTRKANCVCCAISTGESESGLEPAGSPANWRCLVLEKLRRVKLLLDDGWHTGPNHSRPASCVVKRCQA